MLLTGWRRELQGDVGIHEAAARVPGLRERPREELIVHGEGELDGVLCGAGRLRAHATLSVDLRVAEVAGV